MSEQDDREFAEWVRLSQGFHDALIDVFVRFREDKQFEAINNRPEEFLSAMLHGFLVMHAGRVYEYSGEYPAPTDMIDTWLNAMDTAEKIERASQVDELKNAVPGWGKYLKPPAEG